MRSDYKSVPMDDHSYQRCLRKKPRGMSLRYWHDQDCDTLPVICFYCFEKWICIDNGLGGPILNAENLDGGWGFGFVLLCIF